MPVEIRVPALGESIVEATVSKWLKQTGDPVTAGEALLELETDKVNLEVPAEQSGVLGAILKAEGETVQIGDMLGVIDEVGAGTHSRGRGSTTVQPAMSTQPAVDNGQPLATTPHSAPVSMSPASGANNPEEVFATPVAQRVAAEHNIDIRGIQGSGPGGRITKEDVLRHGKQGTARTQPPTTVAERSIAAPQPVSPAAAPSRPEYPLRPPEGASVPTLVSAATPTRREERVRMSRRRQTIARRLVEAQQQAAMLTTFNEIDMSAVMAVRQRRKDAFMQRHGIGLGFMSFFARATVGALKAFPLLNAEIQGDELVIKHYYDLGIAVGTDEGLVVPVVRDADRKSFAQIEREIADLARRARDNTLTLTDLQGGTFTITNGGIYGSLMSTPILNTPQVGILGMHKIEERPLAINGAVVIRPMMYVALSYDHRIVDGSEAVRFLVRIKELVEDPEVLLLEG